MAVADTFLLRLDISMTGDYTGALHEKLGPNSIDGGRPVSGALTVSPDCSFTSTLNVQGVPGTIVEKGVYFDQGKEFYGMGVLNTGLPADQQGLQFSFCQGTRIGH